MVGFVAMKDREKLGISSNKFVLQGKLFFSRFDSALWVSPRYLPSMYVVKLPQSENNSTGKLGI